MSNSQEQYIESLKRIKETEEKVQSEIETHRTQIEKEIKDLNSELENAIAVTKTDGKKMVETNLEQARNSASKEADEILKYAENKSKDMSINFDQQTVKEIIKILLSGI
jgi:vacuolar-type H+-ATPase subunit H